MVSVERWCIANLRRAAVHARSLIGVLRRRIPRSSDTVKPSIVDQLIHHWLHRLLWLLLHANAVRRCYSLQLVASSNSSMHGHLATDGRQICACLTINTAIIDTMLLRANLSSDSTVTIPTVANCLAQKKNWQVLSVMGNVYDLFSTRNVQLKTTYWV